MRTPRPSRRRVQRVDRILLPALLIFGLAFFVSAAWAAPQPAMAGDLAAEPAPPCQQCHPDEQAQWQEAPHAHAVVDPAFQAQLEQQQNPDACLQCHTTGFDVASGSYVAEGVTCEACHGVYEEGHPKTATMTLPMTSDTCRTCHPATVVEWEQSSHGRANIECFDCHLSHGQGLRTGSEETLCAACHEPREVETLHVTHRVDGIACSGCHVSEQMSDEHIANGVQVSSSTHGFDVGSQKCLECHSETLSVTADAAVASTVASGATDGVKLVAETARAEALQGEVQQLERRFAGLRNAAIIGMGLALGVGGFVGLAAGIAGMALLHKTRGSKEQQP